MRTIHGGAFDACDGLERITLPLRGNIIEDGVFNDCYQLITVDLVGGIHDTVASLHLERWRNEMMEEINRINEVLPNTSYSQKTQVIQEWMGSVIYRLNHFKSAHHSLLKEATTLLELALWKANLDNNAKGEVAKGGLQRKRERKELRVTSGASTVIRNVLPYLQLSK